MQNKLRVINNALDFPHTFCSKLNEIKSIHYLFKNEEGVLEDIRKKWLIKFHMSTIRSASRIQQKCNNGHRSIFAKDILYHHICEMEKRNRLHTAGNS